MEPSLDRPLCSLPRSRCGVPWVSRPAVLVVVIIGTHMPCSAIWLLDVCATLPPFNLPARWGSFSGSTYACQRRRRGPFQPRHARVPPLTLSVTAGGVGSKSGLASLVLPGASSRGAASEFPPTRRRSSPSPEPGGLDYHNSLQSRSPTRALRLLSAPLCPLNWTHRSCSSTSGSTRFKEHSFRACSRTDVGSCIRSPPNDLTYT